MKQTTKHPESSTHKSARNGANGDKNGLPVLAVDMPVMYEDEGQDEMGEAQIHTATNDILFYGVAAHLSTQPHYRVFSNLNCYFHPTKRKAYFSSDIMVVSPLRGLPTNLRSYRISEHRPPPVLTIEVLSKRSFQQEDLTKKPIIYALLGIAEYMLVDVSGEFLFQRLLIKRLRPDRSWSDEQDPDGGVTSRLGFRVVIDSDGEARVVDATTGKPYARPDEAQRAADALRQAEERIRELEAEMKQLHGAASGEQTSKPRKRRSKS